MEQDAYTTKDWKNENNKRNGSLRCANCDFFKYGK